MSKLESVAEESEQYSRRNSLRISNINEDDEEDSDRVVLHIADVLNVDIRQLDIDRSHRVGKPTTTKNHDMLVKFATNHARQRIYRAKSSLKDTTYNGVFLNKQATMGS